MVVKWGKKDIVGFEFASFVFNVRATRGDSLNVDKELSPLNKGKESGLASREGGSNFLGGKDSISVAGLAGCCAERSSLPCSELMFCSR